ncbi:hypothetical protein Tco_0472965 [Tanacetum coccineum]
MEILLLPQTSGEIVTKNVATTMIKKDRQNAQVKMIKEEFGMKDSILQAGNPVKEILLKLNLPDHKSILMDSKMEVKNFKKDATLKLFKSTNQERCSRSHSRLAKEQAQGLKSMNTTTIHKLIIKVKDNELKTKVEA